MDYGKWVYEQKRKVREARKKTHHAGSLKEVRLRPETDTHDIEIKVKHAREFIEKGHKVSLRSFSEVARCSTRTKAPRFLPG